LTWQKILSPNEPVSIRMPLILSQAAVPLRQIVTVVNGPLK